MRATQILAGDVARLAKKIEIVDEPPDVWPSRYSLLIDDERIALVLTRARYKAVVKLRCTPGKYNELEALKTGRFKHIIFGWRGPTGIVTRWAMMNVEKLLGSIDKALPQERFGERYVLMPIKHLMGCIVRAEGIPYAVA